MTATDVLRRLLDERGVEYDTDDEDGHTQHTWWSDGDHEIAACNSGERLAVYNLTPEQAIAATLGRGECHDEGDPSDFCCSECGVRMFTDTSDTYTMIARDGRTIIKHPNFCPNCGAKVVDPTTNDVDAEVAE